jgi:hypothetical protein
MVIKTVLASESIPPEAVMVSLGPTTHEPVTYAPPQIIPPPETTTPNCYQRRARLKTRPAQVTTPVSQSSVLPSIQIHSAMQPVPQPQVQQDQDPVTPNLGRPSAFRRSPKPMTFSSNRNTSNVPDSGTSAESLKEARLRHIRADSVWCGFLMTYYSDQSVRFKLNSLQLQELEKLDTEILNIRDRTDKYDCKLLMNKFLLLESYNIPDIGGVYDDETISKNFPMELLKMILINKGHNTDNLSKTQLINELNSYDRTILAFTMVSSKFWGPRI